MLQVRDLTVNAVSGEPLLQHVSFNVQACEKIALVGRESAEKTAFMSCLLRFLEPTCGSIKIDGVNIAWVLLPMKTLSITSIETDFFIHIDWR